IEEQAAVEGGAGNPHDSSQAEECLFVHFVSAHEISVVTEVPQEPAEFPECLGRAVETAVEGTALMFSWFENDEPQNVERSLGMPAVEHAIDTDEENALQDARNVGTMAMQPWDMAFHGATSCDLE